jgi:hypothetical protein
MFDQEEPAGAVPLILLHCAIKRDTGENPNTLSLVPSRCAAERAPTGLESPLPAVSPSPSVVDAGEEAVRIFLQPIDFPSPFRR